MSKYIIIDFEGTAGLAERQEDGTYTPIPLTNKTALLTLLAEIANDGSVSEAEANTESKTELTLDQRQAALEKLGYEFDSNDATDDIAVHRDIFDDDEYPVVCGHYTRTEAIELVEEYNNGNL